MPTRRFRIFYPGGRVHDLAWRCFAIKRPRSSSARPRVTATKPTAPTGKSWSASADRRFRQLRPRSGSPRAVHRRLEGRQARDLREADGDSRGGRPANARRGRGGNRQVDVYVQLPFHARRAIRQRPDRRRPDRHDLPHPHPLPADGRPRSDAAARQGVVFDLAVLGRLAGDRQPRHRPVPLPRRRNRQRLGLGADVQQGPGDYQRRLPAGGHLR